MPTACHPAPKGEQPHFYIRKDVQTDKMKGFFLFFFLSGEEGGWLKSCINKKIKKKKKKKPKYTILKELDILNLYCNYRSQGVSSICLPKNHACLGEKKNLVVLQNSYFLSFFFFEKKKKQKTKCDLGY